MVKACAACTSNVPLPLNVTSPAAPKFTLPLVEITLTEPPEVVKPAPTLTEPPCSNKLPTDVVPVRLIAWLALNAPAAVTTTEPLVADTPCWGPSLKAAPSVALACTRLTLTAAVLPRSSAEASVTPTTPSEAVALKVWTSTSMALGVAPSTPTPAPACNRRPEAYTSVAALVSASSTEAPATTLTKPQPDWPLKPALSRSAALRASTRPKVTFLLGADAIKRTLPALV